MTVVFNEVSVLYCRLWRDIGYLLQSERLGFISIYAGISRSQPGCCGYKRTSGPRSFAQVSGELQRSIAVARKNRTIVVFFQPAQPQHHLMRQLKMISWTGVAGHYNESLQIL